MKLYGVPISPFVQRVLIAGRIKGHEVPLDTAPGMGLTSPEFRAISPMGRIPLLVDGDLQICESAVIVAHLDEVLDGPPLLPHDAAGRARARAIAQICDGEVGAGLRPIIVQKAFAGPANPALLDAALVQLARGLDAIERLLDEAGPWAAGPQPGIADAILMPLLTLAGMLQTIPGVPDLLGGRPRLAAYRLGALMSPLGKRTRGEMETGFHRLIEQRRQQAAQQQQ